MKVILTDNIKSLGQIGDIKDVNDGYARNFLIPRKLARAASAGAAKDIESLKTKKLEASRMAGEQAQQLADKLSGVAVQVTGKANAKGTLFAAIESDVLADAISKAAGAHVTPDQLHPHDHLKTVGEHEVMLQLADGITAEIKVEIIAAQ